MDLLDAITGLGRDYTKDSFNEKNAKKNPFEQFKLWFQDAIDIKILDPNAMALSTATKDAKPSCRMVLLKGFDERGFVFYTNYESQKAMEMAENPHASLLFFWDKLERQIRIDGFVEKITSEESNEYFLTRGYTSRLGAWASMQSKVLHNRFKLLREVAKFMLKYPKEVPLPPYWGGYRLSPCQFEFWQGRPSRLHDRLKFSKNEKGEWIIKRLYP